MMFNSTLIAPPLFSFILCVQDIYFGTVFFHCVLAVCFLLGTPANLWCLWFFFSSRQKVKYTHVFPLNHIVIEITFCLECAAEIINMLIFQNYTFFIVIYFFWSISWSGRPLIQICICIEHYLAVCHPVTFLRYKGIKYKMAAAALVWFLSFGYMLYQFEKRFPNPVINSIFIIALAVISFCCVSVLRALKHPGPGDMRTQTGRDGGNQQKRNAFNTIFSTLLLILFSYIPQALLGIFTADNTDKILFECSIMPSMTSFNVFGVIITPILKIYKKGQLKCLNCQTKK